MDSKNDVVEAFFERSSLTLDLVGLTDKQQQEGSIFLGGTSASFVKLGEKFDFDQVGVVVFRWGDEHVKDVFARLFEHIESPCEGILPFAPSAVVGGWLWSLTLQDRDFDPKKVYYSDKQYVILPFNEVEAANIIESTLTQPIPRPEILGKINTRYMLFEMAIDI